MLAVDASAILISTHRSQIRNGNHGAAGARRVAQLQLLSGERKWLLKTFLISLSRIISALF